MSTDNKSIKNKNIWVISPQEWGKMRVSKHHYAIAFANLGYQVIFVNPPKQGKLGLKSNFRKIPTDIENLNILQSDLSFPYGLKFKAYSLFKFFIKNHIRQLIKVVPSPDLVLSFDMSGNYLLKNFPNAKKIYFPADEPRSKFALKAVESADLLVSVTEEILDKFPTFNNKLLLHHGLSGEFVNFKRSNKESILCKSSNEFNIHCGLCGNFLRPDIDFDTIDNIVSENSNVFFHFFGAFKIQSNNLGGTLNNATIIKKIESLNNVHFYGIIKPDELPSYLFQMDMFLVCYNIEKDQSGGTNYHKIMEYLSTGKIIVSNNVTRFKNTDLFSYGKSRTNNDDLSMLFYSVTKELYRYNVKELQDRRRYFANSNSYSSLVHSILESVGGI